MFQTEDAGKIKTRILCSVTILSFFRKSCYLWDNVEKYGKAEQATYYSIIWRMSFTWWITKARMHTHTHTHTPRECNTYWFCTSAMVMQTPLGVTLHVQACLVNLVITWWWLVSFTPRLFYLQGSASLCPLNRMHVGLQRLSGRCGEMIPILTPAGNCIAILWMSNPQRSLCNDYAVLASGTRIMGYKNYKQFTCTWILNTEFVNVTMKLFSANSME